MDVVPRVVTFVKKNPVIQLVVASEPIPPKPQETRGRKRKMVTEDDKEKKCEELKEGTQTKKLNPLLGSNVFFLSYTDFKLYWALSL